MSDNILLSLSAIISLLPPIVLAMRRNHRPDTIFWLVIFVATIGPVNWVLLSMTDFWHANLQMALWVTISATMVIFFIITLVTDQTWRLSPLITAYLTILGLIALVWGSTDYTPLKSTVNENNWFGIHVGVSVTTYALVTIAAIAAFAAVLREKALKNKKQSTLIELLPSVIDCEKLEIRLLILSEIILTFGLASGMALQYSETGTFLVFDHKTVLSIFAFVLIGGLLFVQFKTGLRGMKAAQIVLLSYLLLTLGYPGVKFVTDIILA